jgi:hypothetical protein
MSLITVTSWLDGREREMLAYLIEESRILRREVGRRCLREGCIKFGSGPGTRSLKQERCAGQAEPELFTRVSGVTQLASDSVTDPDRPK